MDTVIGNDVESGIDPFCYFPELASRITGLGGPEQRPSMNYVFHTQYLACQPGYCMFTLQFDGLAATSGVLVLHVQMLSTVPGSQARTGVTERINLRDLAAANGWTTVRFESLTTATYALYGSVIGQTDATASRLSVYLDRPGRRMPTGLGASVESRFGRTNLRQPNLLTSDDAARFSTPVSQMFSVRHLDDPACLKWQKKLGESAAQHDLWERAYLLETLDRYGVLHPDVRGVGIGSDMGSLPALLAGLGCHVRLGLLTAMPNDMDAWRLDTLKNLGRPALCSREELITRVAVEPLNDALELGISPDGFDFFWSSHRVRHFGDRFRLWHFFERALLHVNPGGLLVHFLGFTRGTIKNPERQGGGHAVARGDIEKIALNMISRGHEVAQLKFELGSKPWGERAYVDEQTLFALIVRRSKSFG